MLKWVGEILRGQDTYTISKITRYLLITKWNISSIVQRLSSVPRPSDQSYITINKIDQHMPPDTIP